MMAIAKKTGKITPKTKPAPPSTMKLVEKESENTVRTNMIAEAAYYRAEKRNFSDGDSYQDWLQAEREIDTLITKKQIKLQ